MTADAGDYYYRVTAFNRYGESAAANVSGAVSMVAGDGVTITITKGGGDATTGYNVYRTKKGEAQGLAQFLCALAATGATNTFQDLNFYLPGCSRGYMLQENLQALSFRQLAPMMKIPLATVAASIRWMQLLYGTPIVYSTRRAVVLLNVGDR